MALVPDPKNVCDDEDVDPEEDGPLSGGRPLVPKELTDANAAITSHLLTLCENVAYQGVRTGKPGVTYCDLREKVVGTPQSMRYVFTNDHATQHEIAMPPQLVERLMPDAEKVFPTQIYYVVRATDSRFDVYSSPPQSAALK